MSEHEETLSELAEIKQEMCNLQKTIITLTDLILGSKQWITPKEAGKLLNRTVNYLTNNKDKMGLIYSQVKKNGKILFSYASVMEFIQSKSGNHSLNWESKIK